MAALKVAAAQRLAAGQAELDLGLAGVAGSGPLAITSSWTSHLCDSLCTAYRALGFESVTQGDKVFRDLVLARIIEVTSKADALRVLAEVGGDTASSRPPSSVGSRSMPNPRGANRWQRQAPAMPGWVRRRGCSTT